MATKVSDVKKKKSLPNDRSLKKNSQKKHRRKYGANQNHSKEGTEENQGDVGIKGSKETFSLKTVMDLKRETDSVAEKAYSFINWAYNTNAGSGGLTKFHGNNIATYTPPADQKTEAFNSEVNKYKNRSPEIVCLDQSRVLLPVDDKNSSDYIHANHITFENFDRPYIATQLPLEETRVDFWRMVVSQEVDTIIALFDPSADTKSKPITPATATTPPTPNTPTSFSTTPPKKTSNRRTFLRIFRRKKQKEQKEKDKDGSPDESVMSRLSFDSAEATSYWPLSVNRYLTCGPYFINTRKVELPGKKFWAPTIYSIEIVEENCANATFVKILNYANWTSQKKPCSPRIVISLIQHIRMIDPLQKGKVVVHCDNGVNRTSALIFCDVILQRIYNDLDFDVVELCRELRNQRASSFQDPFYFVYSIYAVATYIMKRGGTRANPKFDTIYTQFSLLREQIRREFGIEQKDSRERTSG
ncbi:unnamed protein product [Caenorhabditis auriculariae]|uniref:Tyrosine-protein phosphatase domain-containing protein n=1 Tax=Caenorhabditis auriculariae TaxID=2777116 RepID=A0A8S1GNM3_9PELO|nr:unnamed protein product [Caenorhabditis auriculariae]